MPAISIKRSRDRLSNDTNDTLLEYEAVLFFLSSLNETHITEIKHVSTSIALLSKHGLRDANQQIRARIDELRREFGIVVSREEIVREYRSMHRDGERWKQERKIDKSIAYYYKVHLRQWIKRYRLVHDVFDDLPAHARIGLYPPPQFGKLEVIVPEAMHFEEMAILFNECAALWPLAQRDVKQVKHLRSLLHACYSSTFHFIESYLNGIAFDFVMVEKGPELAEKEVGLLLEWDANKDRERNVALRDKLLQYPKIILGSEHPPLTESNSSSLQTLLSEGKRYRDAITHTAPLPPGRRLREVVKKGNVREHLISELIGERTKDDYLIDTDFASLTRVVDAAVDVVGSLDTLTDGYMSKLGYIGTRDAATGIFPSALFS